MRKNCTTRVKRWNFKPSDLAERCFPPEEGIIAETKNEAVEQYLQHNSPSLGWHWDIVDGIIRLWYIHGIYGPTGFFQCRCEEQEGGGE